MAHPFRVAEGKLKQMFISQFNSVVLSQLQILVPALFQLGRALDHKAFAPIEKAFPMEAVMSGAVLLSEIVGALSMNMQKSAFRILQKYLKSKQKKL